MSSKPCKFFIGDSDTALDYNQMREFLFKNPEFLKGEAVSGKNVRPIDTSEKPVEKTGESVQVNPALANVEATAKEQTPAKEQAPASKEQIESTAKALEGVGVFNLYPLTEVGKNINKLRQDDKLIDDLLIYSEIVKKNEIDEDLAIKDPITGKYLKGTELMSQLESEGSERMGKDFQKRRGYSKSDIEIWNKRQKVIKELQNKGYSLDEIQGLEYANQVIYNDISEAYHAAKAKPENTRTEQEQELVKAVEELLTPKTQEDEQSTTTTDRGAINQTGAVPQQRGDGGGRRILRSEEALQGAPNVKGFQGPIPELVNAAKRYAEKIGIPYRRQAEYVEADAKLGNRLADAYTKMKHSPNDPKVKEAYAELIRQVKDQYQTLVDAGYEFTFFDDKTDPYDGKPWRAMEDLRSNKKMAVYGTYSGYGTEGITDAQIEDNPMLEDTGLMWPDQLGEMRAVTVNDLFRAVHDAFGHGLEGAGFRARGEENAWQAHVRLFTGPAIAAMTSETRGQNSWLNFGPFAEKNKTASVDSTIFAEQKIGLLPEWAWKEGIAPDVEEELPTKTEPNEPISQQSAAEVPVQPTPGISGEVAQGTPQAEPKEAAKQGEEKEVAAPSSLESLAAEMAEEVQKEVGKDKEKEILNKLKEAKEKASAARRSFGVDPYARAAARAKAEREVFDLYVDLAKLKIQKGIKNFSEFLKELGENSSQIIQDAWDVAIGKKEIPYRYSDSVVKSNIREGKEKVSQIYERLEKGLNEKAKKSVATRIKDLTGGAYTEQKQDKIDSDANDIISEIGIENAVSLVGTGSIPMPVENAILSKWAGELDPENIQNTFGRQPTAKEQTEFSRRFNIYQEYGTQVAQTLSQMRKSNTNIPSMFAEAIKREFDKTNERAMGSSSQDPTTDMPKIKSVAQKVNPIKKDVFNTLSSVVNGLIDAVKVFEKGGRFELTDGKLKNALKTLLNFGKMMNSEQKEALSKLMENVVNRGNLAIAETKEAVRDLILENAKDINGRLQVPMSAEQLSDFADAFTDLYEEIATQRIAKEIEKAYGEAAKRSPNKDKNPKVAKLLLYGDIENDTDLRNAFAQKYGLPSLTPQQAAKLKSLATAVANAPAGFQKNTAMASLNAYIATLQSQAQGGVKSFFLKASDLLSYYLNNILATFNTLSVAFVGNTFRSADLLAGAVLSFDFGWAKYLAERYPVVKITYTEASGQKTATIDLNETKIAVLSALRGNPKLSHLMQGELPDIERKIRESNKRYEKIIRRAFQAASSRALTGIDASTAKIPDLITRYQMYKSLVQDWYKKNNIKATKRDIQAATNALISPSPDFVTNASLQAMGEIRGGLLWNQLGFAPDADFPMPDSIVGFKSLTSKEAKIYLDYLSRVYEILMDGQNQMAVDLQVNLGMNPDPETDALMEEVNKYILSVTNEVSFFGAPRGTSGEIYKLLIGISNKMPFLKYTGKYPLFIGPIMNSINFGVKTTPFVNLLTLGMYQATGTRGGLIKLFSKKGLKDNKEFEFKFTTNYDKKKLAQTVVASNLLLFAYIAWQKYLYPDDEEGEEKKRQDILKGNYSGSTPIQYTPAQRRAFTTQSGDILKEGYFYHKGKPVFPYVKTPYLFWFSSAEYFSNYKTFERENTSRKVFVENDPELKSAIGGYLMNFYITAMNQSSLGETGRMVNDLTNIKSLDLEKGLAEKMEDEAIKSTSNFIRNMIPYSRAQIQTKNFFDAIQKNPKKQARDFFDKVSIGMLWEDYVIKSELTDPFGRPVEERLQLLSPILGMTFFDTRKGEFVSILENIYKGDKYMDIHLRHNYSPKVSNTKTIPANVDLNEEGGVNIEDLKIMKDQIKQDEKVDATSVNLRISELAGTSLSYRYTLEFSEVQAINKKTGEIVKTFFDSQDNMKYLDEYANEDYRLVVDKIYSLSQMLALFENHPELCGGVAYEKALNSSVKSLNKLTGSKINVPGTFIERYQIKYEELMNKNQQ